MLQDVGQIIHNDRAMQIGLITGVGDLQRVGDLLPRLDGRPTNRVRRLLQTPLRRRRFGAGLVFHLGARTYERHPIEEARPGLTFRLTIGGSVLEYLIVDEGVHLDRVGMHGFLGSDHGS